MSTRKLIVKVSYGLVASVIIVLICLLVYKNRLIRQMSQNNEELMPSVAAISDSNTLADNNTQTIPLDEGGMEQMAEEIDTLRYQLEASEEELDMAREDLANDRGQVEDTQELIAWEKRMRENPSVMNMRRRDEENWTRQQYGSLFEGLGLSDEIIESH